MKRILALQKSLELTLHSGSGQPIAVRVNVPRLAGWLSITLTTFFLLGSGTLLFFRELEINRKLQTRLLVFETNEKLWQTSWNTPRQVAATQGPIVVPLVATQPAAKPIAVVDKNPVTPPPTVNAAAKISELSNQCGAEECQVRLALTTTGAGVAEGHLLIVLEAEVPRIGGAAAPEAQMRKRYFLYPEQEPVDELDQAGLQKLQQKAFKFSRALKTTASFKMGKLLRPLSVNAYVFDANHSQVQHERRAITDEP